MYKVVFKSNGKLLSANAALVKSDPNSVFVVEYHRGKWVKAPVGGLLVFKSLKAAQEFSKGSHDLEIWECDVRGEVRLPRRRLIPGGLHGWSQRAIDLWTAEIGAEDWGTSTWPEGTAAYKEVMLRKLICRR